MHGKFVWCYIPEGKLNVKPKQMKQHLDDVEEELAHVNSQKHKVQRELDEAVERSEVLEREVEQMNSKLRTPVGDATMFK